MKRKLFSASILLLGSYVSALAGEAKTNPVVKPRNSGELPLQVDLGCPENPATLKPGWTIWAEPKWYDMYADGIKALKNVDGSGVDIRLTVGYDGMGCLKVKGMRMHSKKGNGPPTGIPDADPICNTWFEAADWASHTKGGRRLSPWGNILLAFYGLPAGEYELFSYHNHWYHCDRYECDCLGMVEYRGAYKASRAEQGLMPSIKAMSFAQAQGLYEGFSKDNEYQDAYNKLSKPAGVATGGVTAIKDAYHVTAQHVSHDEELIPSLIKFRTDGSAVLVIYEAPQDYWDYRDYPGGRAILNGFRLEQVIKR